MTSKQIILLACLIALIGCDGSMTTTAPATAPTTAPAPEKLRSLPSNTTLPPPVLAHSEKPVIVLYDYITGGWEASRYEVDTAVWSDGKIVWRKDDGLFLSHIDIKQIDALLQRLHEEGVFGDGSTYYGNFGPDSSFRIIEVNLPDRKLKMASWHEAMDGNPKAVATARGLEALEGRDRNAVLASQPPEYKRFVRIWSDVRSTVESWRPTEGEPFNETVPVDFRD